MRLKLYFLRRFNKRCYCSRLQNVAKGTCFSGASQKRRNIPLIAADLKTLMKKTLPKPKLVQELIGSFQTYELSLPS